LKLDLPAPDQILEDLADQAAGHIDDLAPTAFDDALAELTEYHKFLLSLNATATKDGSPFSFAEIVGDAWHAPHVEWIAQYRRLFGKAAHHLPDDDHFIRTLAYVPRQLMPRADEPRFSSSIVNGILDLGPALMHRLETWVTRRTTIETSDDTSASPKLALAGSDAKAYENVLPEIVGAWESLLLYAPLRQSEDQESANDQNLRWIQLRESWPFLWRHLSNTAYCLATAVWNEDVAAARLFREALVRWPDALSHQLRHTADLPFRRSIYPNLLELEWTEASAQISAMVPAYLGQPSPDQLFMSILHCVHDDVSLIASEVFLRWTLTDKQLTSIGAMTAGELLRQEGPQDDWHETRAKAFNFRSLLLAMLRGWIAPERYKKGTYGSELDRLAERLDGMTERRVVPGRVYTPSTINDREALLLPELVILTSCVPTDDDGGVIDEVNHLSNQYDRLPEGDRSLRNIRRQIAGMISALKAPSINFETVVAQLGLSQQLPATLEQLQKILRQIDESIEKTRIERLRTMPLDAVKIENIRVRVETSLLSELYDLPFFTDFTIKKAATSDTAKEVEYKFTGINKSQIVSPVMDYDISNFFDKFIFQTSHYAARLIWRDFSQIERQILETAESAENTEFWREIRPQIERVGADPVLVVSRTAQGRQLWRIAREQSGEHDLAVHQNLEKFQSTFYIATIEGVAVFNADFSPGTAWLFSGRSLRCVQYEELERPGQFVGIDVDVNEDLKCDIRLRFRQKCDWSDAPIFEIRMPNKGGDHDKIGRHNK